MFYPFILEPEEILAAATCKHIRRGRDEGASGAVVAHLAVIAAVDELLRPRPVRLEESLARQRDSLESFGVDVLVVELFWVSGHDPAEEGPVIKSRVFFSGASKNRSILVETWSPRETGNRGPFGENDVGG